MMMILNVRWCWDWAFRPLSRRVAAAPRVQRPPRGGSGQFFPGPPLRPRAARGRAAAEERLLEEVPEAAQVRGAEAPRPEAAGHGILAAEVVHLTLIGVREDLISGIDGFELVLVAGAGHIGVQLAGLLLIGPPDLVGGGLAAHAEDLVVVAHAWSYSLSRCRKRSWKRW